MFNVYIFRLHWKEIQGLNDGVEGVGGGGSVQHRSSHNWGKKIKVRNINTKDCSSDDTGNETDSMGNTGSEQNMTEDDLVWMTIGVDVNENKNVSRGSDIKEDIDAILQRMEIMSVKNSINGNNNGMEEDDKNRGTVYIDRQNERTRKNEYSAERSTKSGDSPITYSFCKMATPSIYHSLLNSISDTSAKTSTKGKDKNNEQNNQNKEHERRIDKNTCINGINKNEDEMHVICTYDEDRGSAAPNRFWILIGTRPSAVLEIREYSGNEVLGPQFFIDDVSFKIFNPNFSGNVTKSSMKLKNSDELSIERDTLDRIKNEKMKNICMWAKIVSETIENLNEKKKSCNLFNQLKRENEVLVRHRDLIMTLQSSSKLTNSSRATEKEHEKKNSIIMNDGNILKMNNLKKLININSVEKSDNGITHQGINRVIKESSEEHSRTSTLEDFTARTRTTEQRMFFTEELKLLIEQQCVRTLDFLSSLNLTVTQASSNIIISNA